MSETEIVAATINETEELPGEPRNPYKGLKAFRSEDRHDFFGRDSLIEELAAQLQVSLNAETTSAPSARLLSLVGPSGSGKSSIVLAGLLPRLQAGALFGSEEWVYLDPMIPGVHPIESLTLALTRQMPDRSLRTIHDDLEDETARGLHLLANHLRTRPETSVVLFVDQFEDDLVGDLLFEVQGQVGAMPLLQFTLDQLFQRCKNHHLTLQAYHEIGEVKGALAKHTESTYASLPTEEHRTMARTLFLRLIDPGLTEQDTICRRAALAEISLPDAKLSVIIGEVVDTFVYTRLLTTNEIGGITTVEVSHEALIREWPRLTEWLREGREDIRLQQAISEDSIEWEQRGQPKDRLYRGSQLTDANTWARRNFPSWSEVTFLQASRRQHMRHIGNILLVIFLLTLTTGLSGWLITRLLRPSSNPALVTTLSNNGPGSLRQAIDTAAAGSTITFDSSLRGIIRLTSGLNITKNLYIRGTRTGAITISSAFSPVAGDGRYAFSSLSGSGVQNINIDSNSVAVHVLFGVSVTISNMSFKGITDVGVPIFNEGTLTLTACIFSDNSGRAGGDIVNNGTLDLINSTISGNTNMSPLVDGTIENNGGTLTIMISTISSNKTSGFMDGEPGNQAGGIYSSGTLTLTNSTVSDNTASPKYGVGGIQIAGGTVHITFSTIYGNTGYIGGIAIGESNLPQGTPQDISRVTIRNSLVAGNHGDTVQDIRGTLTSDGDNLIQNVSGATITLRDTNAHDLIGVSPNIGPLRNNGGPTQTHALFPNSPAIDKISLAACHNDGITTDQRGVKRPQGSACDIGAYEYVPFP